MGISAAVIDELDHVNDWGYLTTDLDLVVTRWNRWLERHTGLAAATVCGRPLFETFPDLPTRGFDRHYRQALAGQTVVLSQRFHQYLLPMAPSVVGTGLARMQQTARIVPLVQGAEVSGTLTIIEDVTERVAHEAELRERVDALKEADRRKDEFLALLAHELRNPLVPIRNATEMLKIAGGDATRRDWCSRVIERQLEHLTRLVDDLLDVARVTRGILQLRLAPVDLATVVSAAVETVRPVFDARRQELTVRLPNRPVRMTGDAARLTQVLVNLFNNASRYSPDETPVSLTAEPEGGHIVIRVRDRGAGIPPDMLVKVFELFTQVDRTQDRSQGGLGIGLTLVQRLVTMHGGTVTAHSDGVGHGSEFTIKLPAQSVAEAGAPVGPTPPAARCRVLVADGDRESADTLAELIRALGHDVEVTYDAEGLLAAAARTPPDVALVDLRLSRPGGAELVKQLRGLPKMHAAVLVSQGVSQTDNRKQSANGFDHHLTKPIDLAALQRVLVLQPNCGGSPASFS